MTPEKQAQAAHDRAAFAAGQLGYMLVKRRLSQRRLQLAIDALQEALESAKRLLTPEKPMR